MSIVHVFLNFLLCVLLFSVLLAENIVKISDFGTCRTWNEISVEMSFIGTYAWMGRNRRTGRRFNSSCSTCGWPRQILVPGLNWH